MNAGVPEVSVVMGVYNGASTLGETIQSVLSQGGVELELIAVNDGSSDVSGTILDEVARMDSRVRVIHQSNQGLTQALVRGCAEARGKYVARQDAGDISLPGRLELQRAALAEDRSVVFVSCWTEYVGPNTEYLYCARGSGAAGLPIAILAEDAEWGVIDGPVCHPSVMFRKDSYLQVGGYRSQFYFGQDWDLWYRLASVGRFKMIERPLYRYRVLADGISGRNRSAQQKLALLSLAAMRRQQRGLSDAGILAKASTIRPHGRRTDWAWRNAGGLYFIGECLRRNGDYRAKEYFRACVTALPVFWKAWIRLLQFEWSERTRERR